MASASVVGQHPGPHRLDSEPQLLFLKLSSAKKKSPLPKRPSWDKILPRRSSGGDGGSGAAPSPPAARGARRGSAAMEVMASGARAAPPGRRDTWSGEGMPCSPTSPTSSTSTSTSSTSTSSPEPARASGLPLERLTQGRTGVVRLARTEPPRMEAWSIFPRRTEPWMRAERGEGHRFEAKPVTQDWCDACSRQISAQALKCQSKSKSRNALKHVWNM